MSKISQQFFSFNAQCGRIKISIIGQQVANDFWLLVHGGDSHVGAVALAGPQVETQCVQQPNHRDGEIALDVANILTNSLGCNISVTCGIHYDHITLTEIAEIRNLAKELAHRVTAAAKAPQN